MIKKQKILKTINKIIKINPINPDPEKINKAAVKIRDGGIIVFPTRSLYGLGVNIFDLDALESIFKIKQRMLNKPVSVLVAKEEDIADLVKYIPAAARQIIKNFWPGQITIVFEANDNIPSILNACTGKIGIRLPEQKVARALVDAANTPITGTSANISGNPGCYNIKDLDSSIKDQSEYILDSGVLKGGAGSTVIDVTVNPVKILREGAVSAKDIFSVL